MTNPAPPAKTAEERDVESYLRRRVFEERLRIVVMVGLSIASVFGTAAAMKFLFG